MIDTDICPPRRVAAGVAAGLATMALVLWPPAAQAQEQRLASAGLWSAFAATAPDQRPVCGLSTVGSDGRRIVVQQSAGETGIEVLMDKPSWTIPDGTSVEVGFQFDGGAVATEPATGSGTRLTVELPFERSVPFMRSLRYGSQIQVHFTSGNEPPWTGGLRGSSAMVDAFNDCRVRFAAAPPTGTTQPFAAAPAPATPSPAPAPGSSAPAGPATAPAAPKP
jgi:hypothetical protein